MWGCDVGSGADEEERKKEEQLWPLVWTEGRRSLRIMGGLVCWLVEQGIIERGAGELPSLWTSGDGGERGDKAALAQAGSLAGALVSWGLLRPYQGEAVAALLGAPLGRGIAHVATGGGKTRIIGAMMGLASLMGGTRWLYVVGNKQLCAQSAGELERVAEEAGRIARESTLLGARARGGGELELTVSTYAGVARGEADYHGIVVDEVHQAGARGRARALADVVALYRLGLSGTPLDRQDWRNALVIGLTGPVVYTADLATLTAGGFLSPGKISIS